MPAEPQVLHGVPPTSSPRGVAAALCAVTAWGLGNTIIASVPMSGLSVAFYRLLTAVVIYLPILYVRGGRLSVDSFRYGWKGGVAFGADIAAFFVALRLTSVANATTISALQPLVIMGFASIMFGERIRSRHVVGAIVATLGVALVAFGSAGSGTGTLVGDLVAVVALFCWAAYFITSKQARTHLPTFEYMTVMNMVAFMTVAPMALLGGDLFESEGNLTATTLLTIVLIVAVPGSGHILMNWAHGHTTLVLTSLITLAMPVLSTVSAAVLLDQRVAPVQAAGIVAVLVSLALVIIGDARASAITTDEAIAGEPAP